MILKIGIVGDMHLGPLAYFRGELRKMGSESEEQTARFVKAMNETFKPDIVLNLGDIIQEVGDPELDLGRYRRIFTILEGLDAPIYPTVGNHDLIGMTREELLPLWHEQTAFGRLEANQRGAEGRLYYRFQAGEFEFLVLESHEERTKYIALDEEQIAWLERSLLNGTGPVVVVVHHSLADQDTTGSVWFEDYPQLALIRERVRVRELMASSGRVVAVINGHLHRNNITWHDEIPYITVQSLIENMTGGAEGKACEAWGEGELTAERLKLDVVGLDPARWDLPLRAV